MSASSSVDNKSSCCNNNNNNISSPLIPRILSGSLGSIVTALAVTPLEVVKIRQQAAGAQNNTIAPTSFRGIKVEPCAKGCGTLVLNNGLMDCVLPIEATSLRRSLSSSVSTIPKTGGGTFSTLLSIARNEGYSGLYAGLRPTLVMSVPNTVLYFTAYDELSIRMRLNHALMNNVGVKNGREDTSTIFSLEDDAKKQDYIPLIAGSTARLIASLATAPLELIRTRQASAVSSNNTGMIDEFGLLLRQNGVSSLYVGLAPTLWRDVPFSGIYWLFLERFRNALSDSDELGAWGGHYYKTNGSMEIPPSIEAMHAFVSGAAAGSIAAAFTTPFDVVKTRRQMVVQQIEASPVVSIAEFCDHYGLEEYSVDKQQQQMCSKGGKCVSSQRANMGTFGHMQKIVTEEGVAGLWKGNVTRMVKVAPACAIMISCYEFGKRVFGEVI